MVAACLFCKTVTPCPGFSCDLLVRILSICLSLEGKYKCRERNSNNRVWPHSYTETLWQRCGRHQNLSSWQFSLLGALYIWNIPLQWHFKDVSFHAIWSLNTFHKSNVQLEEPGSGDNFPGGREHDIGLGDYWLHPKTSRSVAQRNW